MTHWWKKYGDKVGMEHVQKTTSCPTVHKSHPHKYPYMWYQTDLLIMKHIKNLENIGMNWWKMYGDKAWMGCVKNDHMSNIHKPHPHTYSYMWCIIYTEIHWISLSAFAMLKHSYPNGQFLQTHVCRCGLWMLDIWSFFNTPHPHLVLLLFHQFILLRDLGETWPSHSWDWLSGSLGSELSNTYCNSPQSTQSQSEVIVELCCKRNCYHRISPVVPCKTW